ncbi:(2Fe-2S)-binding protein [Psychrobium sp. 1_MG-2023]|uniref:(2Fe-2S)-binding protein n=1 Tax=Psychrobium sp. 1_MG-2023 TaxID=3062624 RepID=UPI000C33E8C3|nr:(2Fe-2S)-binding protein [Psychrobium sp. 1_MG-2023]MDP2562019.1 (2Fe-2S)-binding protein [Psychrobium sp. 1_MG-2023]PKF58506.1 (2Fe-2S)-binding protein [Alteromonadales bacterium alter-6D02]
MYVCVCLGITDTDIRNAVKDGGETMRCLKEKFAIASECGGCVPLAKQVLNQELAATSDYYQVA